MATSKDACSYAFCENPPTRKLQPCQHVVCDLHWRVIKTGSTMNCGYYCDPIQAVDPLSESSSPAENAPADPPVGIANTNLVQARFLPAMNSNGAPNGERGNSNNGTPFYRGAQQAQMAGEQDASELVYNGRARYVPPQMRAGLDIIRPESSMSNISAVTNKTFASQLPMGSFSNAPSQLNANTSSYNPYNNGRAPQQQTRGRGVGHGLGRGIGQGITRPGFPGGNGVKLNANTTPLSHVGNRAHNNLNVNPASYSYNNPIARPTPVRRDSGAGGPSHSEQLAILIKAGHAENPLDPDYGNPGPTKRPPPPPAPHPFPSKNAPPLSLKINGKTVSENTDGNPKPFLGSDKVAVPEWLAAAIETDAAPTMEQAFKALPFIEACRYAVPSTAGVVKVANIPYATTRAEVNAFLGKNTLICHQPTGASFQAVHIIMDRHSGKTMDAFVEVSTRTEAIWVVNSFQKRVVEGRPGRLDNRVVEVLLSSQDELMANIFPRTKFVTWENGVPKIDNKIEQYYPTGETNTGFIGFLQDEEIVHIYKHAEVPQRSPFVLRCLVRTYEYLISTIYKFPWFAHEHVLLHERDALFKATHANVVALIDLLRHIANDKHDNSKPTRNTLLELAIAVFVCPGFTDAQKAEVAATLRSSGFGKETDDRGLNLRFNGVGASSSHIPFITLVKQPGVQDVVVEYFAMLFQDATTGMKPLSLADLHAMRAADREQTPKFGELEIDYKDCKSMADAGRAELRYLETILGRILVRAGPSRSGTASRESSLLLR